MIFQDPVVTGSRRISGSPGVSARPGVVQIDLSKAFNAWCRPRGIAWLPRRFGKGSWLHQEQGGDIYHQILTSSFCISFNFQDYFTYYRERRWSNFAAFCACLWKDLQHLGKEKVRSRNWVSGTFLEDPSKSYGIHAQRSMKSRIGMSSWQVSLLSIDHIVFGWYFDFCCQWPVRRLNPL